MATNSGYHQSSLDYTYGNTYGFLNPHSVPLYLPLMKNDYDVTAMRDSLEISAPGIPADYNFTGFEVNGSEFSFALDISDLVKLFGQGVYVITIEGKVTTSPGSFITAGSSTYVLFLE